MNIQMCWAEAKLKVEAQAMVVHFSLRTLVNIDKKSVVRLYPNFQQNLTSAWLKMSDFFLVILWRQKYS